MLLAAEGGGNRSGDDMPHATVVETMRELHKRWCVYRYILLLIFVLFIPGILFVPETDTLHYKLSNIALMLALESSAVASTTLTITHLYFVGDWKSTLK